MEREKTIGKYKLLREIGKGGMAIVYKALEAGTQRNVALKVLLPNMVDRSTVERFNREARAMARLKHPNIIEVYDFGMTGGQHYLAMEFIEGESLKTLIKRKGPLSVEESLDIIAQAGKALAYAHSEGMIHRDIKSGNIMITKEGKVKVMDFGLVQIAGVTRVTTEGSAVGTVEYMSPEQASDEELDSRTDIYSLGVTMYEMLTGHPPFEGDSFQAVLIKQKSETAPSMKKSRPEIPMELEEITQKAMAKDITQRYQKAEELLDDINRLRGIEVQRTQKKAETAEKPQRPQRKKISRAILGLIIIGLLGYIGYINRAEFSLFLSDLGAKIKMAPTGKADLVRETEELLKNLEIADEHHSLGLKFYRDGFVDEAIAEYKKAVRLRPDYPLYYKDLAIAYEEKGEIKKAVKAWQELLKYDETSPLGTMAREHFERLK
ncbi:MAG: protein kinase [Candidatus Omnitrophica bacterium]|nr:protein kinase [Candidatus Omnitrophota bacterium]